MRQNGANIYFNSPFLDRLLDRNQNERQSRHACRPANVFMIHDRPDPTQMIDTRHLDELAHRLAQAIPPGLHGLRRELEDNFRAILQSNLDKLDLVSRDQFEASQALLEATRNKLDRLEARVGELEQQKKEAPSSKASRGKGSSRKTTTGKTQRKTEK